MPLPASSPTVAETYDRIRNALKVLASRLPGFITQYSSPVAASALTDSLIPYLRDLSTLCPDSSGFPVAWVAALEAHAQAQQPTENATWTTLYDAAGTAIRTALAASVDALPKDLSGYTLAEQWATDGTLTIRTLSAAEVAGVKTALEALAATVA